MSIKDFFSKCDHIRSVDLVAFTEKILNEKLYFLCSVAKDFENESVVIFTHSFCTLNFVRPSL